MKTLKLNLIAALTVWPASAADRPTVAKGWLPEYTAFVKERLTPEMLGFPAPSFCPKFYSLTADGKKDFWAALMESIAYAETGFNRLDVYREDGQSISSVTKVRNTSEGLLQLSYSDAACKGLFDFEKDRKAFLADYARIPATKGKGEITSRHPERTILDPYKNLECGIRIWTALIRKSGNKPALTVVGRQYWSTLNPARRAYAEDTVPHFKKRMPKCFK